MGQESAQRGARRFGRGGRARRHPALPGRPPRRPPQPGVREGRAAPLGAGERPVLPAAGTGAARAARPLRLRRLPAARGRRVLAQGRPGLRHRGGGGERGAVHRPRPTPSTSSSPARPCCRSGGPPLPGGRGDGHLRAEAHGGGAGPLARRAGAPGGRADRRALPRQRPCCARRTCTRTSSWPSSHTSCATPSARSGTPSGCSTAPAPRARRPPGPARPSTAS